LPYEREKQVPHPKNGFGMTDAPCGALGVEARFRWVFVVGGLDMTGLLRL
jgi:hypothetical protein